MLSCMLSSVWNLSLAPTTPLVFFPETQKSSRPTACFADRAVSGLLPLKRTHEGIPNRFKKQSSHQI